MSILFVLVLACPRAGWLTEDSVPVSRIASPRVESFYGTTILASNTLGTALGDFLADDGGLGCEGAGVRGRNPADRRALLTDTTSLSRILLFWAVFILTRPLGATLGDLLTKPIQDGELHLGRVLSSLVIAGFTVACVGLLPQRAGSHPGERTVS